jgi:hypothetical protein
MNAVMYAVIVLTTVGRWTLHSWHDRKSEAQDQADTVHGRIIRLADDGSPADVTRCPACGGDPMLCECDTPWSA